MDDSIEVAVPQDDYGLYAIDILDPSYVSLAVKFQIAGLSVAYFMYVYHIFHFKAPFLHIICRKMYHQFHRIH